MAGSVSILGPYISPSTKQNKNEAHYEVQSIDTTPLVVLHTKPITNVAVSS